MPGTKARYSEDLVILSTLEDAGTLEVGAIPFPALNNSSHLTYLRAFPNPLYSSDKWNFKITQGVVISIRETA